MSIFFFIDIDECQEDIDPCNGDRELCINMVGSYTCGCEPGFAKKNGECVREKGKRKLLVCFCNLHDIKINQILSTVGKIGRTIQHIFFLTNNKYKSRLVSF